MSRLLVVGAGPPTREGGVDLFLELMAAISTRATAEFVWVGARPRGVARRLDAEIATLELGARIGWRSQGTAPEGPGVIHVVTARSTAAAEIALAEAASGVPLIGLASAGDVAALLESRGCSTIPYPDIVTLAARTVDAAGGPDNR